MTFETVLAAVTLVAAVIAAITQLWAVLASRRQIAAARQSVQSLDAQGALASGDPAAVSFLAEERLAEVSLRSYLRDDDVRREVDHAVNEILNASAPGHEEAPPPDEREVSESAGTWSVQAGDKVIGRTRARDDAINLARKSLNEASAGEIRIVDRQGNVDVDRTRKRGVSPKFELWKDKAGQYRFSLRASDGAVVLTSAGYASKASALNGIESAKAIAASSDIAEID